MNFLCGHIQSPSQHISGKHKGKRQKLKNKDVEKLVLCSAVERYIFGNNDTENQTLDRRNSESDSSEMELEDSMSAVTHVYGEDNSSLDEDSDQALPALGSGVSLDLNSTNIIPAKVQGNGTDRFLEEQRMKTKLGMVKAEQKEIVKRAARRGCVFGFALVADPADSLSSAREADTKASVEERVKPDFNKDTVDARRKCEVVSNGRVVEPSFAKGDWGIRWRESVP